MYTRPQHDTGAHVPRPHGADSAADIPQEPDLPQLPRVRLQVLSVHQEGSAPHRKGVSQLACVCVGVGVCVCACMVCM